MKDFIMGFIIPILIILIVLFLAIIVISDMNCKKKYTDEIERRLLIYEQNYDNYCLEDALKQQEE